MRLQNGHESKQIADWLNSLPDTTALMAAEFDGQSEVFIASPDWMPRNFFRRIEVVFPIEDGNLRERVRGELLETILQDNVKARFLRRDGAYTRKRVRAAAAHRSQSEFVQMADAPAAARSASGGGAGGHPRYKLAPSPFAPAPTK